MKATIEVHGHGTVWWWAIYGENPSIRILPSLRKVRAFYVSRSSAMRAVRRVAKQLGLEVVRVS